MTDSFPLRVLAQDSAWKMPQVEDNMPANHKIISHGGQTTNIDQVDLPLPTPLITRPTISWGNENAENCRTAPIALTTPPTLRVFFLPRRSP